MSWWPFRIIEEKCRGKRGFFYIPYVDDRVPGPGLVRLVYYEVDECSKPTGRELYVDLTERRRDKAAT